MLILLLLWSSISTYGNEDGSGNFTVLNTENSDYLKLSLGESKCEPANASDCEPWSNFSRSEAQPLANIRDLISLIGNVDPEIRASNEEEKEVLTLPTPARLREILIRLKADQKFVFLEDDSLIAPNNFFEFLSQGKLPLAGIARAESEHRYQEYLYDISSMVVIWLSLPDKARNIIVKKAALLLKFYDALDKSGKLYVNIFKIILLKMMRDFKTSLRELNHIASRLKPENYLFNLGFETFEEEDEYQNKLRTTKFNQVPHLLHTLINLGEFYNNNPSRAQPCYAADATYMELIFKGAQKRALEPELWAELSALFASEEFEVLRDFSIEDFGAAAENLSKWIVRCHFGDCMRFLVLEEFLFPINPFFQQNSENRKELEDLSKACVKI